MRASYHPFALLLRILLLLYLQHSGYAIQTLGIWGNGRVENIWRRVKYLSPTRLLSKTAYFMQHYVCDNIENLILCKDVE